ncbi:hypothetical protein [Nitrosopumilus sp.]|uniref:hypothetical protein n=1 Tax=Nitrosopumilus sp. TaxID=2024843 RepID=UPI00292D2AE8|nr:hypothetical protein [Nitrosopumilus sp.]
MKFASLFLAVLFVLGTFVVPLNINDSYGDGILLFTVHRVAGSGDVNTDDLIKERCFVHVQIDVYSAHHGPFHRNNPDKTFYPGDAFDYQTTTWKDGCGEFWQPCPIQSTPNNTVPNGPNCVKNSTFGNESDSGTGVIDPGYAGGQISLSKRAMAEQWVCTRNDSGWNCGWRTVSASATQAVPGRLPDLTVDMWTVGEEFTEDAGYTSRNLDESYYVWDAINVVHNPFYEFKNDRVGTIFIEYEKIHDPLVLEDEFFCDAAFCVNTMEIPGFLPWTQSFDYGGGNTVFNATSLDDIGEHEIIYIARLYNIVPQIDEYTQSIEELVVEYFPIYESYVYPVLRDDQRLAFDDRIGYSLHYFGNESTDANPDDVIGVHEDRRSKINDYFYSTWGADPWEFDFIDGTVGKSDFSDDVQLTWDEAHDVGIISNEVPVGKSVEIAGELIPTEFPEMVPYEVGEHGTANFLKSGYGKVNFSYDGILDVVLDQEKKIPRYENATVFNTLESAFFAGHEVSFLTNDEHMYPESFFHNTIRVTAVNSDGEQDDSVNISINVIPREEDTEGTLSLNQYVHDKIIFDTDDDGFAQIIAGLDMDGNDIVVVNDHEIYPLDDLAINGNGFVSLEKTRRVLSSFTQYDTILDQTFDSNEVTDISDKYLLDTEDALLPIPLTTGLDALSPYDLEITGDNGIIKATNIVEHPWYDFSIDYDYQINMDDSNALDIKRDPANPRVLIYKYDKNFGVVTSLEINGIVFENDDDGGENMLPSCFEIKSSGTCIISVPESEYLKELEIVATNIWSGTAVVTLPEIDETMLNPSPPNPITSIFDLVLYEWVVILLVLMFTGWVLYKVFRNIWKSQLDN